MNAGKVSEEIKDAIAYNNAKTVTVALSCKEEIGTIFPQPTYQAKIGYPFEVQFIPNLEHYGIKDISTILESVSRLDPTQSLSDYVEFKVKEQTLEEKNKGFYKIEVTVLKDKNDILIQPACVELPEVLSVSPDYKVSGTNANTPIRISLKKLSDKVSYDTDCISLKYGLIDVGEYFEQPVLNEQLTEIKINPKAEQLIALINREKKEYIDITVSFKNGVIKTGDAKAFGMSQNGKETFTIRYNTLIEQTAPVKQIFFVTREEITIDTAESISIDKRFTQESFITDDMGDTVNNKQRILKNRNNGTIYIYGCYYDSESGVKAVTVSEEKTHNWEDSSPVETQKVFTEKYTDNNAQFKTDTEGYTTFCIKHTIKSEEGAILVTVEVEDGCENKDKDSTEQLTVITRTSIYLDYINVYNTPKNFKRNEILSLEDYKKAYKTIRIYNEPIEHEGPFPYDDVPEGGLHETVFGYVNISAEDFKVYADYKDISRDPFSYDEENGYRYLNLQVNSVENLKLKLIVVDDVGVTGETIISFPSKIAVYSMTTESNSKKVKFYSSDEVEFDYLQMIEKRSEENISCTLLGLTSGITENDYTMNNEYTYYGICGYVRDKGGFLGEMQEISVSEDPVPAVQVSNHKINKVTMDGVAYLGIEFTIDNEDSFDTIYVEPKGINPNNSNDKQHRSRQYLKLNGSYNESIIIHTFFCYLYDWEFAFTGISNLKKSEDQENPYLINHLTDFQYDNDPPELSGKRLNYYAYSESFEDSESGPDYCILTIGDRSFLLNSDNSYTKEIPLNLLRDNQSIYVDKINGTVEENCLINYTAYDKAGNEKKGTRIIYLKNSLKPITEHKKEDDKWTFKIKNQSRNTNWYSFKIQYNYFDSNNSWQEEDIKLNNVTQEDIQGDYATFVLSNLELAENTFVRIIPHCHYNSNSWFLCGYPYFLYTGAESSGGFDHFLELGSAENAVAIASDAPVFVQTYCSSRSYNECKDWSVEDWEWYRDSIDKVCFDFSGSNHSAQIYNIPIDQISSGYCYVVIAHFADNHVEMSSVMQK